MVFQGLIEKIFKLSNLTLSTVGFIFGVITCYLYINVSYVEPKVVAYHSISRESISREIDVLYYKASFIKTEKCELVKFAVIGTTAGINGSFLNWENARAEKFETDRPAGFNTIGLKIFLVPDIDSVSIRTIHSCDVYDSANGNYTAIRVDGVFDIIDLYQIAESTG